LPTFQKIQEPNSNSKIQTIQKFKKFKNSEPTRVN